MRYILIWLLIFVGSILIYRAIVDVQQNQKFENLSFTDFINKLENVDEVKIKGNKIEGTFRDGKAFRTYGLVEWELIKKLYESGVKVNIVPEENLLF